jgi:ABC-type multidrug transport system fused ATPase/permease subunit
MINRILEFLNSDPLNPEPISNGITYVSILVGCYLIRTIIFGHSMHFVNLCCTKVLNSANSLVFHKILSLSSASRKYLDVGSIMTHINVDIMSFYYFIMMSTFIFSAPIMILTAIVLLVVEVGWIGLIAPALFALGMVAQNKITKKGFELRKDQLFWTDKRTKCVNEYFSGIRIIKYYGWEKLVAGKIEDIRNEEIKLGFKALLYRTYIEVIMNMLPIFASIIIFGVYSAVEGQEKLNSAKVYTVLSIFNLISVPMRMVIMTIINFMNAKASMERVDHFFGYEEKKMEGINSNDQ